MTTLLVWDAEGSPLAGDWTTVLWRQYADIRNSGEISIPEMVEQHADELRALYLAWIYDLGESRIGGTRVIDHLSLRPGFSYWWMSSLAQKFNASGTSLVDDAIKALALEKLIVAQQATNVVLISGNRRLGDCIQKMCQKKHLGYDVRPVKALGNKYTFRSIYRSLPPSWRAFIYLAWYILKVAPLFLKKGLAIPERVHQVLFIDILVHLDKQSLSEGKFGSNYWTHLVEKLAEWGIRSNWLHIYYRHPQVSSPAGAQRLIQRFNISSGSSQFHVLLERSLNLRLLGKVLRDYFTLNRLSARLQNVGDIPPTGSDLDLWPFHREEWIDTICGKEAVVNCLKLSLIEAAIRQFPLQRFGVYLSENQPWEMALAYAWKAAGHGTLIATPHTTVRFWDLRYHHDARSYLGGKDNGLPLPDILAVNGPVARESVQASGYPADRVTEVEALRFLYLLKSQASRVDACSRRIELRVLVCGDFLAETTRRIIAWLEIAAKSLPHDTVYIFKPHPAHALNFFVEESVLKMTISDAPLADLFANCDVVFTSSITSAAVDAYCTGVPVVQMSVGKSLNTSPLRGLPCTVYATNPTELADALRSAKQGAGSCVAQPYFCLDYELPRWRKLLAIGSAD